MQAGCRRFDPVQLHENVLSGLVRQFRRVLLKVNMKGRIQFLLRVKLDSLGPVAKSGGLDLDLKFPCCPSEA